jgi:hypothetical protein
LENENQRNKILQAIFFAWLAATVASPFGLLTMQTAIWTFDKSQKFPGSNLHDLGNLFGAGLAIMVFVGIFSAFQFLVLACPAILYLSKGPQADFERPLKLYVFAGIILASAPWFVFALTTVASKNQLGGPLFLLVATAIDGALAGLVFGKVIKSK